jgi:N-acetylglucosaminyldiphosphoundecaprenol N-acetyl-beta-D-mannosaminyltransferase
MVLASFLLGGSIRARITGSDLFSGICQKINVLGGYRVFLLGSTSDTLACIVKRMAIDYPQIEVVGTYSPPFKATFSDLEIGAMVQTINNATPDILWVAMTAPKQEKWLLEAQNQLRVPFAGAIGAVFDFYSGSVVRPSTFYQNLGLEWLPRLLQEPKRLYKRMAVSAPIFLWAVLVNWWRKDSQNSKN